jgi:hypothetical protein
MKKLIYRLLPVILLGMYATAPADVLELKQGQVLNGQYVGGSPGIVRFQTSAGEQIIETAQIVSLTFTSPVAAAPAATSAPAAPTAAPVAAPSSVTLPANTILLVRMMDNISSQSAPGASFSTKLEYDLAVDGVVAAKAGTIIYGKVQSATQARRAIGKSTLDLRLVQMVPNGSPVPISTSSYKEAGDASIRKVAKGAAAGAVIGSATGGDAGESAAIGAAVTLLKPGETITVPPGMLLEFNLVQPVTIPVTK